MILNEKFNEMKRNVSKSSIVTIPCILINNCFSSSGNYSNFCLKLLSIQDFLDSLMISHFFFTFEASSEGERKPREIEFDMSFDK